MDLRHLMQATTLYKKKTNNTLLNASDLIYILEVAQILEEKEAIEGLSGELTDVGQPEVPTVKTMPESKYSTKDILAKFFRAATNGDYLIALYKAVEELDNRSTASNHWIDAKAFMAEKHGIDDPITQAITKKAKDNFTPYYREQVVTLCTTALIDGYASKYIDKQLIKDWTSEHIK